MRKPCWGWNYPSIEEVRMAAFHVHGSRCWLVGLMLSCMSQACELMGHHQGSTLSPLTLHLAHLRGAEIWNQIIKIRDERESLRRQNMYSQTPPLAHVQFIPHTQVLWLELQKHTLQQCSGYIFRSNASQYSPAEESALILQASSALVGCSSVLCDWKRERFLCVLKYASAASVASRNFFCQTQLNERLFWEGQRGPPRRVTRDFVKIRGNAARCWELVFLIRFLFAV